MLEIRRTWFVNVQLINGLDVKSELFDVLQSIKTIPLGKLLNFVLKLIGKVVELFKKDNSLISWFKLSSMVKPFWNPWNIWDINSFNTCNNLPIQGWSLKSSTVSFLFVSYQQIDVYFKIINFKWFILPAIKAILSKNRW